MIIFQEDDTLPAVIEEDSVYVHGVHNLVTIPSSWKIKKKLVVYNCDNFISIDINTFNCSIYIIHCPLFRDIQRFTVFKSTFMVVSCASFHEIHPCCFFNGNVVISRCDNFMYIHEYVVIRGNLSILSCSSFNKDISKSVMVVGDQTILHCLS